MKGHSIAAVREPEGSGEAPHPRGRRSAVLMALSVLGLVVLVVGALVGPPNGLAAVLFSDLVVVGLLLCAAVETGRRALADAEQRAAWTVATIGHLLWAGSALIYRASEPDPSAFYPPAAQVLLALAFAAGFTTLLLLARDRITSVDPVLALDGAIAGFAVTGVAALWLLPAVPASSDPNYPGDALFLAALAGLCVVTCVAGLTGWRPGWMWTLIVIGVVLNVTGHAALVALLDDGAWQRGTIVDPLLISGAVFLGFAARVPSVSREYAKRPPRRVPVPLAGGMAALAMLTVAAFGTLGTAATVLAVTALAATLVRMTVALELVDRTHVEARTDPLTSLGNRRALIDELGRRIEDVDTAEQIAPFTLALFDLDGFKAYNDRFGHLGGDALLRRLAHRLAETVGPGMAFRMGGDEFCAVIESEDEGLDMALARARAALTERGDGFAIAGSCGTVRVPAEAVTVTEALQRADTRMYADKEAGVRSVSGEPDIRLRRGRVIDDPARDVGSLGHEVACILGMNRADATAVARAAELRDIGKIAVPAEILEKPGPLDDDELNLVRQHAIIGERILRAAPALADLAPLVRSSHEHVDGGGYPDGMTGDNIPLGARIVAVCGAYAAMTHRAPHREARSPNEALDELRACAGTQFDAKVVAAFAPVVRERLLTAEIESVRAADAHAH